MSRQKRGKDFWEHKLEHLVQAAEAALDVAKRVARYEERIERAAGRRWLLLSQAAFARKVGLDIRTVRAWERRGGRPADPATRAFLSSIANRKLSQAAARGRTVQSALRATFQRYERSSRNPLHAWQAVWMCTAREGELVSLLPPWCSEYLHSVAGRLLDLPTTLAATKGSVHSQSDTARQVSGALGLTRQGWSAFDKLAGDTDKIARKLRFDESQLNGAGSEASLVAASKYGHEISIDGAKKAVQGGKKLLTYAEIRARSPQEKKRGLEQTRKG